MQQAEVEEKDSKAECKEMMKDNAEKRVTDSKFITDKEGTKANDEQNMADGEARMIEGTRLADSPCVLTVGPPTWSVSP